MSASIRRRRFRVAIDYGYSPAAFTLPLVLGPLGVEAIGARGFFVEDDDGGGARADRRPPDRDRRSRRTSESSSIAPPSGSLLVDERGESVPADLGLLLVVRLLALAGRSGRIAVPITTTGLVDQLVEGSGAGRSSGRSTR